VSRFSDIWRVIRAYDRQLRPPTDTGSLIKTRLFGEMWASISRSVTTRGNGAHFEEAPRGPGFLVGPGRALKQVLENL